MFPAQFNAFKKMQCPFLTRLSTNYVRNYGASLLKNYANQCPVASRVISNIANNAETVTEGILNQTRLFYEQTVNQILFSAGKCPFMANVGLVKEASKEMQEDIIDFNPAVNKKGQ